MDATRGPSPTAGRSIVEIFSWEVYPRKIPRPPRIHEGRRLKSILCAIIILELTISTALFMIPFTPGYTSDVTVEGRFLDASGRPVASAHVSLDTGEQAFTDVGGRFIIEDVSAGLRVFQFSAGGTSQTQEAFVSTYHSKNVVVVQGQEQSSLPGEIRSWQNLNGLFFGSALIVFTFAMVALLALARMKKQSISFSACGMSLIAAILVLRTALWLDFLAGVLFLAGILGLFRSYRAMRRKRIRLLTMMDDSQK